MPGPHSTLWDNTRDSSIIDRGPQLTQTPEPGDIRNLDPEIYLKRLSELQTPNERLVHFFTSLFRIYDTPTHEASVIGQMAATGFGGGLLYGGLINNRNFHQDYIRKQNASAFEGRHVAQRHYFDSYLYGVASRGFSYGVAAALLCGSAGIISLGSINYRNKLYLPDWIVGFGTLGAASRLWLGLRGVTAGGALGVMVGLMGFGMIRSVEMMTGGSVTRWRYLYHIDYMQKRGKILRRQQSLHDRSLKDMDLG